MSRTRSQTDDSALRVSSVTPLVVDLWRIRRRAIREGTTTEAVLAACDMAIDRAASLGFEIQEMVGEPYDENSVLQVLYRDGGAHNLRVSECISPAVYFNKRLVKRAEVVLRGEDELGEPDS